MSIVIEALPELGPYANDYRVIDLDQLLRSGHYYRAVLMRTCNDQAVGCMVLEERGRDRLTLEEEKQKAVENHRGWHRFQPSYLGYLGCRPAFSGVIYAPRFPRSAERGFFENDGVLVRRWYLETIETEQRFPLSPEAMKAASQLMPPDFLNGKIVSGNCSIELIGSSPAGNVLYASPGVTETWTQLPRLSGYAQKDDHSRIRRGFAESMYNQLTEGIPGLTEDAREEKVFGDLDGITAAQVAEVASDFETIFGHQLTDLDIGMRILRKYRISEPYAAGLYHMLAKDYGQPLSVIDIKGHGYPAAAVKGQVTGVVSFGIKVVDRKTLKPIIHHEKYDTVA